jgi:hypothetical protein
MAPLAGDQDVNAPLDGSRWAACCRTCSPPTRHIRWTDIKLRGIHGRGGLSVDLTVLSGSLTHVTVRRDAGQGNLPVTLTCGSREVKVRVPLGAEVYLDGDLALIVEEGGAR